MYKFRKATEEELSALEMNGCSKLCSVYDLDCTDEKFALFFGKLITLFGEPDYTTDDYENMYSYWITAEDGQSKIYLEVYHGASVASVGGKPMGTDREQEKIYMKVAGELISFIESAEPSDYEWQGVYEDIPVNIKYTVKDGKTFIEYEYPAESEEDYE
ncbi:MAG: hypothetical protein K2L10_04825 [Ruminococcus sp.]|nr:hypothetical protein [Ruminococcus sp.]